MEKLALSIGGTTVRAPVEVPTGGAGTFQRIIQIGVQLALVAGVLIALFYIIQAGIQWTVSGGDKQRIEQARMKLTYSVVGLILMLSAFFILSIVFNTFGITMPGTS